VTDDIDKQELASDRTDLAEDRTVLAHERSFASWVRTGMACVGIGLGFNALFRSFEPDWVPKAIASIFLAVGILIFIGSEQRAATLTNRLEAHKIKSLRPMRVKVVSWSLALATVLLVVAIWLIAPT
jgi:putative membrane protein